MSKNTISSILKRINNITFNCFYSKQVYIYLFRILIFLILSRKIVFELFIVFLNPIFEIIFKHLSLHPLLFMGLTGIFNFILHDYITQKLCGLFKTLDNLNFFVAFIIVLTIDFSRNYFLFTTIQFSPVIKIAFNKQDLLILLPFSFLLYKFFQYLTKKYPNPFEKIGYYCSVAPWKKLLNKAIRRIED